MEPINEPAYWTKRLREAEANNQLWMSIFRCPQQTWAAIEDKHRLILAERLHATDSVLDCACGYGALLDVMPKEWYGGYFGIDLTPAFIEKARQRHPHSLFGVGNLMDLSAYAEGSKVGPPLWTSWGHVDSDTRMDARIRLKQFDWAVVRSIRPMVIRHQGQQVWDAMRDQILTVARRILYLEYDPTSNGEVEPTTFA